MGKQKNILKNILSSFDQLTAQKSQSFLLFYSNLIRVYYKKSLNKKDLTRRLLFDTLLSDDDILTLLRIIFDKEK